MKNFYIILALAIFGLFFFINILTLNDGHNWGDDFAQYIRHAINLVEHKPYASDISIDYWVVCPPGFPLLLSSVIYWFGINFKILKLLNVFFWAISALAVYGLALNGLGLVWARMLLVWFLTLPFFFFFKQNVLSDIPFMCFVLLSIWALMKNEEYQQKGLTDLSRIYLFLSIFCMSYSILIRWAGIGLFLAVIVYFCIVKRAWKKSLGFILGALVAWLVTLQCGSLLSGYFYKTTVSPQDWFWASWHNMAYNFEMLFSFYVPVDKLFSKMPMPVNFSLINTVLGLLLIGIMGFFVYRLCRRRISFMGCFILFYLMGIIFWPVRGDARYMLPLIIPMTIYGITWVKPVFNKAALFVFLILIFQNIFIIGSHIKFNDDNIYQKESLEMMQWVGLHIKTDERYMFDRPRALGLLTNRIGASFWVHPEDKETWYKRIRPLHINYLIADKHADQFSRYNNLRIPVNNEVLDIRMVWENGLYKIYKVF